MEENPTNIPNVGDNADLRAMIQQAAASAEAARLQREAEESEKLAEMRNAEEMPEIPDDLLGEHTVEEMGNLARVGKGTTSFNLDGNRIQLRTLKVGEELEILNRVDGFKPTAQARAYATYATSTAIEAVNGEPYFKRLPIGPKDDMYQYRFNEFKELYLPTIDVMLEEYNKLRQEMIKKAFFAKKE